MLWHINFIVGGLIFSYNSPLTLLHIKSELLTDWCQSVTRGFFHITACAAGPWGTRLEMTDFFFLLFDCYVQTGPWGPVIEIQQWVCK